MASGSGSTDLVANAPALHPPAVISANTVNVAGGSFTAVAGDQHLNQTTVNIIHPQEQPKKDPVKEVLKILRKHATVKTWDVHRHVSETRAPDTGLEFDASEDMELWRGTPRGFIWATGSPGAGKTHLASSVFDRLHAQTKEDEEKVVVITYLRYNDETTEWDTVVGLLIHLVEAKPLPSVLEIIKAGFAEHEQRNSRPTFDQLSQILRAVVRKYKRCYIIIDGLDEAKYEIQMMLINLLATLDANVLLMSRVLQLVQDRLQELRSNRAVFVTVAAHDKDLDRYISHIIDTNPRLARLLADPKVQARLREIVKTKATGMFLHVSLQMEALRDCLDVRSIFDVVNGFPTGMDALYLRTIERIDKQPLDHGRRARRALAWILYAHRALLLTDVQHAIAAFAPDYEVQQDRIICEGDLAMICCGLIAVDEKTRRVRLVHETAQHYLGELLKEELPAPHEMMALTCMKVLERAGFMNSSISTLEELEAAFASTPLLEYAHRSVGHHIREALKENPSESLRQRIFSFVSGSKSFPYHHSLSGYRHIQRLGPIHVAVLFNLPRVVRKLLKDKNIDVNTRSAFTDKPGWTSLMLACIEGHADVIPSLFESSQLDVNDALVAGQSPLIHAASRGHDAVVQALLAFNTPLGRVLANAAKLVGTPKKKRFIDVNRAGESGRTALMRASENGHSKVVELLLAAPAVEPNLCDRYGDSALMRASNRGHTEPVRLLLAAPRTDVNLRNLNGDSALMQASSLGYTEIVKLLLAVSRVNVNYWNQYGNSALMQASSGGHTDVVRLLLAVPGVQLNIRDDNGDSALTQASYWGRTEVVKLFVAAPGVDLNLCNHNGDSALIHASFHSRAEIVKVLLAAPGVQVNHRNNRGESALMRASYWDNTEIIGLLLAAPAVDIDLQNLEGRSALQIAQAGGNQNVVDLFEATIAMRSP